MKRTRSAAGTAIALALAGAVAAGLWLAARDSRARVRVGDVLTFKREAFAHDPVWLRDLEVAGGGPVQEMRVRVDDVVAHARARLLEGTLVEFSVKSPDGKVAWVQSETPAPLFSLEAASTVRTNPGSSSGTRR